MCRKPKQLYYLCDQLLLALIYSFYICNVNLCFHLFLLDGSMEYMAVCAIYGCFLSRKTVGVTLYRSNTGEILFALFTRGRVNEKHLKSQTKNQTLRTCILFLLLLILFLQYTYRNRFQNFSR